MGEEPFFVLAVLGALGSGVMAGVFCAFSVLVMRGLAALPPAQGVAAMNAINSVATSPVFLALFLGTATLIAVIAVVTFVMWPDGATVELLLGSALYLCGAFGVTVVANVPRNERLGRLAAERPARPGAPGGARPAKAGTEAGEVETDAVAYWPAYVREWTRWNHVRTVSSAAAAVTYLLALA
ncbi:DUF1772 domain-containing protein [Streptomyces mangrovisoli]|uniref:DUF1772 domain-containing protein n=1 Tax=Streptomyces mangrovisoli TaxID=1428628 RepID=A0A1J4P356_9ACTN|nr:anthrone oxygenase family protein [Streptomyces mangrovisoli]OIJ69043.1 hypothetical protein WN71_004460 [Streptomyces mangrovisoli]